MARGTVLSVVDREEISRGVVVGDSGRVIAARLGRHYSVVNREIARRGGRGGYRASVAHQRAVERRARSKLRKVEADPLLAAAVNVGLA